MVSSLQIFEPKFCVHFSSLPHVLRSPPISISLIKSYLSYLLVISLKMVAEVNEGLMNIHVFKRVELLAQLSVSWKCYEMLKYVT
jgi:hypothetical protein